MHQVKSGTVRVKCLAQELNVSCPFCCTVHFTRPGLKPSTLNPEMSAQTMKPWYLHTWIMEKWIVVGKKNNVSGDRYLHQQYCINLKSLLYLALLKSANDSKFHVRKWLARCGGRKWRSPAMTRALNNTSLPLDCPDKWYLEKN